MSRRLTIMVADAAPERLRAALTMALAQRALGGEAHVFLDAGAVAALAGFDDVERHRAAGQPTRDALVAEALDAGARVTLCQTGLAAAGLRADALDPRFGYGGMVGLLAGLSAEDRLVVV